MRLGFFSDAHGNVEAFDRAFAVFKALGVEKLYFLGDALGYFDSARLPERLDSLGVISIQGNHEAMLLSGEISKEQDRVYRLLQHREDYSLLDRIRAWPISRTFTEGKASFHLFHGSAEDPVFGYAFEDRLDAGKFPEGVTLVGATHRPFIRQFSGKTIINVGSVGYPRDHGTLGSLAWVDTETLEAHVLRFDISDSIRTLRQAPQLDAKVQATMDRVPTEESIFGERWEES